MKTKMIVPINSATNSLVVSRNRFSKLRIRKPCVSHGGKLLNLDVLENLVGGSWNWNLFEFIVHSNQRLVDSF